jgi:type I restriction enzyme S subunit
MTLDWKSTTWGELATLEYGKGLIGYEDARGDYPVYGTNGQIGWHSEPLFNHAGVIIGRKGAYRGVHYSKIPFYVIDTAFYLKPKVELDLQWAYYQLLTLNINIMDSGSAIPSTSRPDFYALPVKFPPLPEQRAIAEVLGALDDKIELNRRMNATLEAIASAVFKARFVENEEAMKWEVGKLGGYFNLTMGQSPPGETYNEEEIGIPFFQGRTDFGFRFPTNRVYCTAPTRFAEEGDTLVSVRAPVGDINMAIQKCAIGRGVAAIRHKTGSRSFTYYTMKYLQVDFVRFEAGGTVFGSINKNDFQSLEIFIPPYDAVKEFEEVCFPIGQMIEKNEKESRTLASLRDALLPKLMSGEVRVKVA